LTKHYFSISFTLVNMIFNDYTYKTSADKCTTKGTMKTTMPGG